MGALIHRNLSNTATVIDDSDKLVTFVLESFSQHLSTCVPKISWKTIDDVISRSHNSLNDDNQLGFKAPPVRQSHTCRGI